MMPSARASAMLPFAGARSKIFAGAAASSWEIRCSGSLRLWWPSESKTGRIVWSNKEQFSVWSGALATAGGVVFYGTLDGFLKAVDAKSGKELYKFKTPSGIIGNVMTYSHQGKQYVAGL